MQYKIFENKLYSLITLLLISYHETRKQMILRSLIAMSIEKTFNKKILIFNKNGT